MTCAVGSRYHEGSRASAIGKRGLPDPCRATLPEPLLKAVSNAPVKLFFRLRGLTGAGLLLAAVAGSCGGLPARAAGGGLPQTNQNNQSNQTTQQTTPSGHLPQTTSSSGAQQPKSGPRIPTSDAPLPHKAESAVPGQSNTERAPLLVPRLAAAPKIEDFVAGSPSGPVASTMLHLTGFIQQDPDDGAPVTEATSAFLGYTGHDLYLAFICRDRTPNQIRAHLLPRDQMGDDDKVEVTFDTFNDHRRGLLFQTNALGIEADATWTEGVSQPDFSFDTVWDTWGKRTSFGYVVLMRIPFQSLRFRHTSAGELQVWGLVLRRWIAHASERAYWPRVSRQIAGRLTQDAPIEGFADVQRGHNIQLIPYVLGQNYRKLDNRNPLAPTFDQKLLQGRGRGGWTRSSCCTIRWCWIRR